MTINVNPEVFKVRDPRVDKLKQGLMSAEEFAGMAAPGDVFVLVDNTIYALSEAEYYASRAVLPVNVMTDKAFHKVLDLPDKSFMHRLDAEFLDKVSKDLPGCAACQYRKYKDEVYKLAKKYNIQLTDRTPDGPAELKADNMPYPDTTAKVVPLVSLLLQHMFRTEMPVRTGCIDCVEKHVSQAWVLGNEALCGYPEHLALVIAHLGEAIDELPSEFREMKNTLMFCLAKTKASGMPFVPVYLLLPLINTARSVLNQRMEDQRDNIVPKRSEDMEIDFTEEMMAELLRLPCSTLERIGRMLKTADQYAEISGRTAWEGAIACAGEMLAMTCPKIANMLRNRRLLFIGNPSLAKGDWSFSQITTYIDSICSAGMK